MSEQSQATLDPTILGPITPEEALWLAEADPHQEDPHVAAIAQRLGQAVATEGNVFLLVTEANDDGSVSPVKYVNYSKADLGTSIRPKNQLKHGLPELAEGMQRVNQPKTETKETKKTEVGTYAFLLSDEYDEPSPDVVTPAPEVAKNPRLERLFAPIKTLDEFRAENPEKYDYSHLFLPEGPEYDAAIRASHEKSMRRQTEEDKYSQVSDEARTQASDRLATARRADRTINQIVYDFERTNPDSTLPLVDVIRTNADLRYKLGSYFYNQKMTSRLHNMPYRVVENTDKSPSHRGYSALPKINSQEYASLLALAMIDGTYVQPGPGDPIERNANGVAVMGQHRAAAQELLS